MFLVLSCQIQNMKLSHFNHSFFFSRFINELKEVWIFSTKPVHVSSTILFTLSAELPNCPHYRKKWLLIYVTNLSLTPYLLEQVFPFYHKLFFEVFAFVGFIWLPNPNVLLVHTACHFKWNILGFTPFQTNWSGFDIFSPLFFFKSCVTWQIYKQEMLLWTNNDPLRLWCTKRRIHGGILHSNLFNQSFSPQSKHIKFSQVARIIHLFLFLIST